VSGWVHNQPIVRTLLSGTEGVAPGTRNTGMMLPNRQYRQTIEPFDWRTRKETAAPRARAALAAAGGGDQGAERRLPRRAVPLRRFAGALARARELLEATTRYGSLPGQAEAVAAMAGALRAFDLPLACQTAEQAAELP